MVTTSSPPNDGLQACGACGQRKPTIEFSISKSQKYSFRCAACEHELQKRLYSRRKAKGSLSLKRKKPPCIEQCGSFVGKPGARCWPCYIKHRVSTNVKLSAKATVASNIPGFVCIEESCSTKVNKADERCTSCRTARRNQIAANANHKLNMGRAMKALSSGSCHGVMFIGDEPMTLSWTCPIPTCGKPMLVNSRCYEHSTGRPIEITVRPRIILPSDVA